MTTATMNVAKGDVLPRKVDGVTFVIRFLISELLPFAANIGVQMTSVFWKDLARNLEDPEFLREYITESIRISTVDAIINALDEARALEKLSKVALARAIGAEPATIRRLLSAESPNPTLGTIIEVAAAVGYRITVEPMSAGEREAITQSLREGHVTGEFKRRVEVANRLVDPVPAPV